MTGMDTAVFQHPLTNPNNFFQEGQEGEDPSCTSSSRVMPQLFIPSVHSQLLFPAMKKEKGFILYLLTLTLEFPAL